MKLNNLDDIKAPVEAEPLKEMIQSYREFVGPTAAFHVEYLSWPGQFESREEEMDFLLDERGSPPDYLTLEKWHEDAIQKWSACEGELNEARTSRNLWRFATIALFFSYLVSEYLWNLN